MEPVKQKNFVSSSMGIQLVIQRSWTKYAKAGIRNNCQKDRKSKEISESVLHRDSLVLSRQSHYFVLSVLSVFNSFDRDR